MPENQLLLELLRKQAEAGARPAQATNPVEEARRRQQREAIEAALSGRPLGGDFYELSGQPRPEFTPEELAELARRKAAEARPQSRFPLLPGMRQPPEEMLSQFAGEAAPTQPSPSGVALAESPPAMPEARPALNPQREQLEALGERGLSPEAAVGAPGMPGAGGRMSREEALQKVRDRLGKLRAARDIGQGFGTAGTVVTRGDIMFGTEKGVTGRSAMPFLDSLNEQIAVGENTLEEGRQEDAQRRGFLDQLAGESALMDKKFAMDQLAAQGVNLKNLSPTEANAFTQLQITYDKLKKVKSLVEAQPEAVGPFDRRLGRAMEFFGGDVEGAEVRRAIEDLFAQYVRSISGAQVSAKEFDRLVKAIPTANDTEEVFMKKAEGALEGVERAYRITLENYARNQKDVSSFAPQLGSAGADAGEIIQMKTADGRIFEIPAEDEAAFREQYDGAMRI